MKGAFNIIKVWKSTVSGFKCKKVYQMIIAFELLLYTTCSEYGAHDFFSNSVRYMFSEASCYVEFKTLFS